VTTDVMECSDVFMFHCKLLLFQMMITFFHRTVSYVWS